MSLPVSPCLPAPSTFPPALQWFMGKYHTENPQLCDQLWNAINPKGLSPGQSNSSKQPLSLCFFQKHAGWYGINWYQLVSIIGSIKMYPPHHIQDFTIAILEDLRRLSWSWTSLNRHGHARQTLHRRHHGITHFASITSLPFSNGYFCLKVNVTSVTQSWPWFLVKSKPFSCSNPYGFLRKLIPKPKKHRLSASAWNLV